MQLIERDAKTVPRGVTGARQLQGQRCSFIKKKIDLNFRNCSCAVRVRSNGPASFKDANIASRPFHKNP